MATLSHHNGRRFIQFPSRTGCGRATVRLGKLSASATAVVLGHIECLIAHRDAGQPVPAQTSDWLGGIAQKMHDRLVATGLARPRAVAASVELAPFLDRYIKSRTDLKTNTLENFKQVRNGLAAHFGDARDLRTITRGEVNDWHRDLKSRFATATVAMHVKKARQMFADAVDRELIARNPLTGLKAGKMSNAERMRYVPAAHVAKIMEHCPDAEWQAIFALARFGGLRVPSETNALLLTDIDMERGRVTIRSPKTAHHPGKDTREIPLFPELREVLADLIDLADDGQGHAFARLRGENLRTTAAKIVQKAGLAPWPKLFQNMRSSRETDLAAAFPLHVACAWMGNTEAVAIQHYLQVKDEDYERAAKHGTTPVRAAQTSGELKKENPRKIREFSGKAYALVPPREIRSPRDFARVLRVYHKALQKQLAALKKAVPHIMRGDIDRLNSEVDAAKARAAGRGAV